MLSRVAEVLLLLLVGVILLQPKSYYLSLLSAQAIKFIFAYLLLGLFFLIRQNQRLMLLSLGCAALLCVILKERSGDNVFYGNLGDVQGLGVVAGHFNLDYEDKPLEDLKRTLKRYDWSFFILSGEAQKIKKILPYLDSLSTARHQKLLCQDSNRSVWLVSSWAFNTVDTLRYNQDYAWHVQFTGAPERFDLLAIAANSVKDPESYQVMQQQLRYLTRYAATLSRPFIVAGQFNTHPWSNELEQVVYNAKLTDSRQGFAPTIPDGKITIWEVPHDHILHSKAFISQEFSTLSAEEELHLGIMAKLVLYPNRMVNHD